jgi:hypothetical protein
MEIKELKLSPVDEKLRKFMILEITDLFKEFYPVEKIIIGNNTEQIYNDIKKTKFLKS